MDQGWPVELEAETEGGVGRRASRGSRAARDLVPVTAAAGAAALFVTVVVGGSTAKLDTASLADAPEPPVVGAPDAPAAGVRRDVTVHVAPRPSRPAPALPGDAGLVLEAPVVQSQGGPVVQAVQAVESQPPGLPRLTFPFRPSTTATATIAAAAPAGPVVDPAAVTDPAPAVVDAQEPVAVPSRRTTTRPTRTAKSTSKPATSDSTSTPTATLSLQWYTLSSSDTTVTQDGANGKKKGHEGDPPPDHAMADERAKGSRS